MSNFVAAQADKYAVQGADVINVNNEIISAICRGDSQCQFQCINGPQAVTLANILGRWSYSTTQSGLTLTISW